jgi:hypothetical protein
LRVHQSEPYLDRRTALSAITGGLGLLCLGGCDFGTDHPKPTGPDPLEPVLATAVRLADRYTAAIAAIPDLAGQLTPPRDAHRGHVTALVRELGMVDSGRSPTAPAEATPVPLPTERTAVLADLKNLEREAQQQAMTCCLSGPGWRAALVGSIAAARASHVEPLS